VRKALGKHPLRKLRRWEDNITMDIKEIGSEVDGTGFDRVL
jgi:uncharacterized protein (UPF0335 family)